MLKNQNHLQLNLIKSLLVIIKKKKRQQKGNIKKKSETSKIKKLFLFYFFFSSSLFFFSFRFLLFIINFSKKGYMSKEQFIENETNYFEGCYGHFGIHASMLRDQVRTNAYKNFILNNAHLFKDKVCFLILFFFLLKIFFYKISNRESNRFFFCSFFSFLRFLFP